MRPPVRGRLRILVVDIAGVLVILFFLGIVVYDLYMVFLLLRGGHKPSALRTSSWSSLSLSPLCPVPREGKRDP
jgi:hypothetical protein